MSNLETLKRLYNEYTKVYLKNILVSVFFSIIVAGSTSAIAWLLDPAIKKIFIEKDQTLIYIIPLAIIISFTLKGVSLYLAKTILIKVANNVMKTMQFQVVQSIINSDSEALQKKHSGKFISHLSFDIQMIVNLVSNTILNLTKDLLTLIGLVTVMFYQNWRLAIFALIMIPLASVAAKSLGKRIGKVATQAQEKSGILTSYLLEIFKNHKIIKIFLKEKYEFKRAEKMLNDLKEKLIKIQTVYVRSTPIMETLTGIMIAGLIFYSGKLIVDGTLDINNFFSFLAAMMLAYQPIRSLATINMIAYEGGVSFNRVAKIIDVPIKINNDNKLPDLVVMKSEINFKDVNFSYLTGHVKAIKNINLSIKGGTMAALVGHSGAGKSTILNLLPRFYDPQHGLIKIDNQNISKVNLNSLRKNISLVSQDIILFDDTIKKNIAYAKANATDEEILKACKFAAADEFIEKLPLKFETLIGENGTRLSGGQKQRISIARAILKESPIILLDEATSSLDADSEEIVQNAILNLTKNKTTLVIAHRLSTIHKADKIFVLKEGQIIDAGNHEFLINNSKEYKSLYEKKMR